MNLSELPIADIGAEMSLPVSPPEVPAPAGASALVQPSPTTTAPLPALPDGMFQLPGGRDLVFSLSVDAIMHATFAGDDLILTHPRGVYESYVFLWMCANPPAPGEAPVWKSLGAGPDGNLLPLYLRPGDMIAEALQWFESNYPDFDPPGVQVLALNLWNHHKAAEVVIETKPPGPGLPSVEKKSPDPATPIPSTSSSISSAEETPSAGTTCSTDSLSVKPLPLGTATSFLSGSPASPLPNCTDDTTPQRRD